MDVFSVHQFAKEYAVDPQHRDFGRATIGVEHRSTGEIVVSNPFQGKVPRCLGEHLVRWATEAPDRAFLAEREGLLWRTLTYSEVLARVERMAAGLLRLGLSADRPVFVLSENSVNFALLALAAQHVGIPIAAASPAYSLMSSDFERLKHILALTTPGMIYVENAATYARALQVVSQETVCYAKHELISGVHDVRELESRADHVAVQEKFLKVSGSTIAKFLFTSGSTGMPKAVINTQEMLCSNQEVKAAVWSFLDDEPPIVVDWLPWNHTFGANYVFNTVLRNGGTLYIDPGRPTPAGISQMVESLKTVSPTVFFNVPRGYELLVPFLERDEALREKFMSRLRLLSYAGAAMPSALRARLKALKTPDGRSLPVVASLGATETAPGAITCYGDALLSNSVGLPMPGIAVKLVPNGGKLEARIKGPNVTPGYWREPDLSAAAFDEEGFYKLGDALRFVDDAKPELGFVFDGRISENFKLLTGTWVSVGNLRVALLSACAPYVQDAVITGHDRDEVGALLFLNAEVCRAAFDLPASSDMAVLSLDSRIQAAIASGMSQMGREAGGSSLAVKRAIVLLEPPSLDAGEITDKGYMNQRVLLQRHADKVARLYEASASTGVIHAKGN